MPDAAAGGACETAERIEGRTDTTAGVNLGIGELGRGPHRPAAASVTCSEQHQSAR